MAYHSKIESEEIDRLFDAVLTLQGKEECYRFFTDLCTISEIQAMAQRLSVAYMLKNKTTYHEIAEKTGVSTATISRVNRCLLYGENGYQAVLTRLDQKGKRS